MDPELALTAVIIFCTVSLLMVTLPEEAVLLIQIKFPEEARLNWLMFSTLFPSNRMSELTKLPIDIPVIEVVVALELDSTRMLLDVPLPPTILLMTWSGAEALFI